MIENRANILEFHKVTTFSEHTGPLWVLEITSDLLVSGSSDKTIKVFKYIIINVLIKKSYGI